MTSVLQKDVHVVECVKNDEVEYWVATTKREHAIGTVRALLPHGWKVELTSYCLTSEKIQQLKLRRNDVRRLNYRQEKPRPHFQPGGKIRR